MRQSTVLFRFTKGIGERTFDPLLILEPILLNEFNMTFTSLGPETKMPANADTLKVIETLDKAGLLISNVELLAPLNKRVDTGNLIDDAVSVLSEAIKHYKKVKEKSVE